MNSKEFIQREVERIDSGQYLSSRARRHVASIMVDDTKVYSYGTHYPLLFKIKTPQGSDLWVRNSGGYSSTTSKHIGMAGLYADVSAELYRVSNPGGSMRYTTEYSDVLKAVQLQLASIKSEMASKKRTNTQVYKWLQYDCDKVTSYINLLTK